MNKKTFQCLKAIMLLSILGGSRVTVGEVSRWTSIPYMTAKRHIEKLITLNLVRFEYYPHGRYLARDFYPTIFGVDFYEDAL
jgi:predicted ArsR family transcriptional regulator